MKQQPSDKRSTCFRLTREALCMLQQLARKVGLNQSGFLEVTIRDRARAEGIQPMDGDDTVS